MSTFFVMLKNVIIFVLLAIPGYLLVRSKQLKIQDSGALTKMLTHVGVPFMVLTSTLNVSLTGEFVLSIVEIGILGVLFTLLMFLLTAFLTNGEKKKQGMMRFCMIFANNGFLGIPLVKAVFGDSPVLSYLIIINIITNVLMFTIGVYLISGDKKQINVKRALLNPVLIAFVLGIILNLLGIQNVLPITDYSTFFSGIVTPLSMTILGIKMASVRFRDLFTKWGMYYVSSVRLIIFPLLGTAVLFTMNVFFPITEDMLIGFLIAFACPTAGLAPTFSDQFNGDTENAVSYTLGTTILSVFTIPLLYWMLKILLDNLIVV